jgi:hypothetical protein
MVTECRNVKRVPQCHITPQHFASTLCVLLSQHKQMSQSSSVQIPLAFFTKPHNEKFKGVKLGDLDGHEFGPPRPIH